jgi:riboflavin synthase alpha subunit
MFAGIVTGVGKVVAADAAPRRSGSGAEAHRLEVDLTPLPADLAIGASVAVNGVCLTLAQTRGRDGVFDVVPETWRRTSLRNLRPGDRVNLECSLRAGDFIDGHFVQGHVEDVGRVQRIDRSAGEWKLWVETAPALMPCIVAKGSIAVDGTSLTVVDVRDSSFSVALVPTTLNRTVLGERGPGDEVNIETDILARLVVRRLEMLGIDPQAAAPSSGVSWERLRESGFVT